MMTEMLKAVSNSNGHGKSKNNEQNGNESENSFDLNVFAKLDVNDDESSSERE